MLKLRLQYFGHRMQTADSLERPWGWERLREGEEGDDRGWDGWMASPTRWTWVWVDSSSWWWTGRPGVLRFVGSQRVRHDWATELNWTINFIKSILLFSVFWNCPSLLWVFFCYINYLLFFYTRQIHLWSVMKGFASFLLFLTQCTQTL